MNQSVNYEAVCRTARLNRVCKKEWWEESGRQRIVEMVSSLPYVVHAIHISTNKNGLKRTKMCCDILRLLQIRFNVFMKIYLSYVEQRM